MSSVPPVREGVLTLARPDRAVVVIDPQSRRAFVFEGKVAKLWLMMEEGRSVLQIKRVLTRGMGAARRTDFADEVSSFFDKLLSLKLVRPVKRASPRR